MVFKRHDIVEKLDTGEQLWILGVGLDENSNMAYWGMVLPEALQSRKILDTSEYKKVGEREPPPKGPPKVWSRRRSPFWDLLPLSPSQGPPIPRRLALGLAKGRLFKAANEIGEKHPKAGEALRVYLKIAFEDPVSDEEVDRALVLLHELGFWAVAGPTKTAEESWRDIRAASKSEKIIEIDGIISKIHADYLFIEMVKGDRKSARLVADICDTLEDLDVVKFDERE